MAEPVNDQFRSCVVHQVNLAQMDVDHRMISTGCSIAKLPEAMRIRHLTATYAERADCTASPVQAKVSSVGTLHEVGQTPDIRMTKHEHRKRLHDEMRRTKRIIYQLELELESVYLTTLYSCDDCQRRVPIRCVRRQASDPWLTLTTVDESGDGALPEPLPDVGSSVV